MGPEYCRNCRTCGDPCADGAPGRGGKLCPQVEDAPRTVEGLRVWQAVRAPGSWSGGGMAAPLRLDRAEVVRRLDGAVPCAVLTELLDDFEDGARAARNATASRSRRSTTTDDGDDDG